MIAVFASGCSKKPDSMSARLKNYEAPEESGFEEISDAITLNHDFGVMLQPIIDAVSHEFEITNNTDSVWTLKEIVNTCSCTVSDITSETIQPGKTEKILLVYKPVGDGVFDDYRKSLVVFEEEDAPKFILGVGAKVRETMTLRPKSLSWTRIGMGQTRHDSFEVQNYSGKNWENLEIASKPPWLDIELRGVTPPESDTAMRQLWLVNTSVDTTRLTSGEHRGEIVITATNSAGESVTQNCPVILQITSAVSAIPAQFFFGNVTPNETATKSIKVMFIPDAIPKDKDEIQFEHNFGDSLELEWLNTEGDSWELQASLNVDDTPMPDEPAVIMSFSDPTLPKIRLPIYVMMSTGGAL